MPEHKIHMQLDKLVLGKSYPEVHRALDLLPMKLGLYHKLFHDESTAMMIGYLLDGPSGALSALLHIWLDRQKIHKHAERNKSR
jgi:hypothetical protein